MKSNDLDMLLLWETQLKCLCTIGVWFSLIRTRHIVNPTNIGFPAQFHPSCIRIHSNCIQIRASFVNSLLPWFIFLLWAFNFVFMSFLLNEISFNLERYSFNLTTRICHSISCQLDRRSISSKIPISISFISTHLRTLNVQIRIT